MQISFSISSKCASLMQITAAICLVQYSEANSTKKCQKWWLKKKKYPVQIEHLICICTCEVTRSKLADRSITVGWFHFVEVGNSRFSSMSTKTWNSSRTKMIYCPPSFSLEQDYTVLAHRSCSEKQHNTKKKINSAYSKETDFSVLSTAWGLQCFKVKELNKHWLGVTIRLNL